MYYMLVKITGDSKKYFIKSKYPIRNRQLMLNKMSLKYDVWDKDNCGNIIELHSKYSK